MNKCEMVHTVTQEMQSNNPQWNMSYVPAIRILSGRPVYLSAELKSLDMQFISGVKQGDHVYLFKYVNNHACTYFTLGRLKTTVLARNNSREMYLYFSAISI